MAESITSEHMNQGKGDSFAVGFPDPCLGLATGSCFCQADKNGGAGIQALVAIVLERCVACPEPQSPSDSPGLLRGHLGEIRDFRACSSET